MDPVKRLRLMTVRYSLVAVLLIAGIALYFDRIVAQGVALGGLAGVLAFWVTALRVRRLATLPANRVQSEMFTGMAIRMVIYALSLVRAYYLDPESRHALFAAALGLLVTHLVMVILGLTGLDLRKDGKTD